MQGTPVRIPPSYAGQSNYPGVFWSATMRAHVVYESRLELLWLWLADFDPDVVRIPWDEQNRPVRYPALSRSPSGRNSGWAQTTTDRLVRLEGRVTARSRPSPPGSGCAARQRDSYGKHSSPMLALGNRGTWTSRQSTLRSGLLGQVALRAGGSLAVDQR